MSQKETNKKREKPLIHFLLSSFYCLFFYALFFIVFLFFFSLQALVSMAILAKNKNQEMLKMHIRFARRQKDIVGNK